MGTARIDRRDDIDALRARLAETEEMLEAIREGGVDALVVHGASGSRVYTLHSAEEPYRTLVEQMHEGALVLSRSGDILYANACFSDLVGEPLESVMGSRLERFLDPGDHPELAALLEAGAGRRRCTLVGSRKIPVSLSLGTASPADPDRLNLVVTDLTELLEADSERRRAERASRSKDEFLATLGHELRSPLNALSSAVQILEERPGDGPPSQRARQVISRQVRHISRLIADLLDLERLAAGKIRLTRQPLDLAHTTRDVVSAFIEGDGRSWSLDVADARLWIDGDAVRLQQILTNLLTNAVKYTPPEGSIRVALRHDGSDVLLTVADTGYGISPALLPHVFDLYMQADRTIDRADGGLGIGLTLVRRLVELHGGTVAAASDGEGRGSTFSIRLPRLP